MPPRSPRQAVGEGSTGFCERALAQAGQANVDPRAGRVATQHPSAAGGQGLDSGPARSNSGQGTRWHEPASMPWTRASLQPSQASQRGRKATRLPVTRLIGEAWWYALSARTVRGPKRRAVGGARTLVGVGPPSQAEQLRGRGERAELPSGVGHQPSLLQVDQAADIGQPGDEGAIGAAESCSTRNVLLLSPTRTRRTRRPHQR